MMSVATTTAGYLDTLATANNAKAGFDRVPAEEVESDLRSLLAAYKRRSAKTPIFDKIKALRKSRGKEADGAFEAYFDDCLDIIDGSQPPRRALRIASKLPFPVNVPSFRCNLSLLGAVLEITEDEKPTQQSRRQNLAITLSQLKNYRGGIKSLYKDAVHRSGLKVSMDEMLKRTPDGLETPKYEVLKRVEGKQYEVREYDDYSVCSLEYEGGPKGFQSLAGYIFGKNKEEKTMAMTTPVFMGDAGGRKSMSFVMPSDYWKDEGKLKDEAPTPLDGTNIEKVMVGKVTRAAMWYGGMSSSETQKKKKEELLKAIEEDGEWRAIDEPITANYNDPFTSPWKRRNEVQVKVERV